MAEKHMPGTEISPMTFQSPSFDHAPACAMGSATLLGSPTLITVPPEFVDPMLAFVDEWCLEEDCSVLKMSAQPAVTKLLQLNTGASIHQLGLGTWQSKPGEVATAVDVAVRAGFRHLDCARVYQNEKEIGGALAKLFAEGVVKREDLFITSKLWNSDHAPEHVEQACRRALSDLGLAQLDLYLIHWPVSWAHKGADVLFPENETGGMEQNPVPIIDTWKAMEALVDAGLVKAIGVSNFSIEQVRSLVENARIKPAVNQVEAHPCLPQHALAAGMAEWGILLQAYSPFGIGTGVKGLVHHKAIVAIAQQEGISAGELLLRWGLAQGYVVLSKSVTPARILANVATPVGGLSEQAIAALKEFGESHPLRVGNPAVFYTTPRPFFDDGIPIELDE